MGSPQDSRRPDSLGLRGVLNPRPPMPSSGCLTRGAAVLFTGLAIIFALLATQYPVREQLSSGVLTQCCPTGRANDSATCDPEEHDAKVNGTWITTPPEAQ